MIAFIPFQYAINASRTKQTVLFFDVLGNFGYNRILGMGFPVPDAQVYGTGIHRMVRDVFHPSGKPD